MYIFIYTYVPTRAARRPCLLSRPGRSIVWRMSRASRCDREHVPVLPFHRYKTAKKGLLHNNWQDVGCTEEGCRMLRGSPVGPVVWLQLPLRVAGWGENMSAAVESVEVKVREWVRLNLKVPYYTSGCGCDQPFKSASSEIASGRVHLDGTANHTHTWWYNMGP